MLLRQHGRRREHCDLFAFHHRFKRGANCNFGFAVTDIAANQSIHRARTFHVLFGVDDRFELVGRFAKRKRMLEFGLPFCVGAESVTRLCLAFGLEREHLSRVIEDRCGCFEFCARPLRIRERRERWRFFPDSNVSRNEIGLFEWDVEFCVIGELEGENFSCGGAVSAAFVKFAGDTPASQRAAARRGFSATRGIDRRHVRDERPNRLRSVR